jgi:glycopeptide antibiotics resistance protein
VLFIIYFLFNFTLFGRSTSMQYKIETGHIISYYNAFRNQNIRMLMEDIFNIILFILVGMRSHLILEKKQSHRFKWILILCSFITLNIESIQLIIKRGLFETDDVINNCLRYLIGYILLNVLQRIRKILSVRTLMI